MTATREDHGLAIVRRLTEIIYAGYSPGELATINDHGPAAAARRFAFVVSMFTGPIPGAEGFSIAPFPVGVCWVTGPNGSFLYDPSEAAGPGEWPTTMETYTTAAMALAYRATKGEPTAGTMTEPAPRKPRPHLWLIR